MYRVLASAVNHPDSIQPYVGLFNHRILDSLAEEGIPLDVVVPRPFAPPIGPYSEFSDIPQTESWGQYTVHHPRFLYLLPKRLFYSLAGRSFAKRVPPYLEETFEVPDVVHACHIYLDGYGMLPYCREHDLPLFVVAHGAILNSFEELPRGVRSKVRDTLHASSGVLCVSEALAEKARQFVPASKVSTVPIGADPEKFPMDRRETLRKEFNIDPGDTVITFVGEFSERKGIKELIELLPQMELPGVEFVFIGHGGPLESELRRALKRSEGVNHRIYTGLPSNTLRQWFVVTDLLLLPSHAEGRPTVIYEAMASKTAILASDVGGVPEQVVDGVTGVLVPPGDTTALRAELESLTSNRELLGEMGEKGYDRLLEQGWTWEDHARRVRAAHETVLD